MPAPPFRVLFVCFDNSCRSQMAEGFLREHGGTRFLARSGGVDPRHLDPLATRVMQESGVDVAAQRGVAISAFAHERFDLLVTLGDEAKGAGADLRGVRDREHVDVDDPALLEHPDGGGDLDEYRRVRDEISAFVEGLTSRNTGTPAT